MTLNSQKMLTIKTFESIPSDTQHLPTHFSLCLHLKTGFPGGSVSKESACNLGAIGSIPGWGRSPGEEIGYPLQYSCTSLVAQMAKNPPTMQETWVRSLGWEDPLGEDMASHSSILAWRIPMDRGAWWATVHGVTESDTTEQLSMTQLCFELGPRVFWYLSINKPC